jgi:hypothetical protein
MIAALALAAAIEIQPGMQTVVACVYDMVRSKSGVISTEVYAVGKEKYVVTYRFREKGHDFIGGIGIYNVVTKDGKHLSTNDSPSGQTDNHGLVELNFLGAATWDQMYKKCRLMPGFDDTIRGGAPPKWQKVQMSGAPN